MQRGHKPARASALDMPEGFDPSGVPCVDPGHARTRAAPVHRRHPQPLPGLAATSTLASVEEVAERGEGEWLIWGTVGACPVLFAVEAGSAAEMMHAVAAGETATAIIEPRQLLLERLD